MSPPLREAGIACMLIAVPVAIYLSNERDEGATRRDLEAASRHALRSPAVAGRTPDEAARDARLATHAASPPVALSPPMPALESRAPANILMAVPRSPGAPVRESVGEAD